MTAPFKKRGLGLVNAGVKSFNTAQGVFIAVYHPIRCHNLFNFGWGSIWARVVHENKRLGLREMESSYPDWDNLWNSEIKTAVEITEGWIISPTVKHVFHLHREA